MRLFLTTFIFLLLLPSFSFAKTDSPADAGSGTGGVTITKVTTTMGGDDGQGGAKAYDEGTRKLAKMPPEWFTCKTTPDCGLIPVLCNPSFAVSKAHKAEAQAAQCAAVPTCSPTAACLQSLPDLSKAVCDKGECKTVWPQPYPPAQPAPAAPSKH